MMAERIIIRKTEDNFLICEDNLSILSKINHMIIKNKMKELTINILEKNRTDIGTSFYINKQSALNNNLHLIDENMSPLGDIKVNIDTNNVDEVIKWITT